MVVTFKKYCLLLLLILICFALCLKNYTPHTFLSGWDTLHPEFNLPLALQRAVFGVFRPDQGLGAVAAHAQIADLPHILILSLLSFFAPLSFLRYLYIFLCIFAGTLGMYYFLQYMTKNPVLRFLGAVFYLLNIGTLQQFFVPFEMFVTQFAILPFLFAFITQYIYNPSRKTLLLFSLATILATPTAFAPTLWYLQFVCLGSYVVILNWSRKSVRSNKKTYGEGVARLGVPHRVPASESERTRTSDGGEERQDPELYTYLKAPILLLLLTLLFNSFWLLPNLYFLFTHAKDVSHAAMNQLFSEEAFLYNKTYGNLLDILTIKTFYFSWSSYDSSKGFHYLLDTWISYLSHPFIIFFQISFALLALFGLLKSFFTKNPLLLSLFPSLFLVMFFLINQNFPTGFLYAALEHLPLFQEAFRFPDDKVLGIDTFLFTIFFIYGTDQAITSLKHIFQPSLIQFFSILYLLSSIFLTMLPAFQGNFLSPEMRVQIPDSYFQLFSYINSQPEGRILTFPMENLWGWQYYKWPASLAKSQKSQQTYQGSGFIWFGIKDPIMDRDFDRWNPSNEKAYQEISQAIYSENTPLLKSLLQKYAISYILVDTSVFVPGVKDQALWHKEFSQMLLQIHARKIKSFDNSLVVFRIGQDSFIGKASTSFSHIAISPIDNMQKVPPLSPISLIADKIPAIFVKQNFLQSAGLHLSRNDCQVSPLGSHIPSLVWDKELYPTFIRYFSADGQLCDHMDFPYPLDKRSYILSITSRNMAGLPLRLCVSDPESGRCVVYSKLSQSKDFQTQYFFIPSVSGSKRFGVNISSIGMLGTPSTNDVSDIQIHPVPLSYAGYFAQEAKNDTISPISSASYLNHSVFITTTNASSLVLSQSYDIGWQLYRLPSWIPNSLALLAPFLGQKVGAHQIVNGWENGWEIAGSSLVNDTSKYVIIFLPQYLEYLGFGIVILTCFLLIRKFLTKSFS